MNVSFHVAEGNDDFNACRTLWPSRFGRLEDNASALHLMARAFQLGSAILARHPSNNEPLAVTVLDFDSFAGTLFVPFILINEAEGNRAAMQRRMLNLILEAFEASGAERLRFVTDDTDGHRDVVRDFNASSKRAGLSSALRIVGGADNLYGDRRKVLFHELFILERERPDLSAALTTHTASLDQGGEPEEQQPSIAMTRATNRVAALAAQTLGNRLMSEACCSGCSEKIDKEFKESKDKENKEGIERLGPSAKLNVENTERFAMYTRIGIQRFNRHANVTFSPLI